MGHQAVSLSLLLEVWIWNGEVNVSYPAQQWLYMNTYSGSSRNRCQSVRTVVDEGDRCFLECIHNCTFSESMESAF